MEHKDIYTKHLLQIHQVVADFISNTLKAVYDLLKKQLVNDVEFNDVRDLSSLRIRMKEMIHLWENQISDEPFAQEQGSKAYKFTKITRKFEFLHDLLSGLDIYIFPRFVQAHKEGCKSATFSGNAHLKG